MDLIINNDLEMIKYYREGNLKPLLYLYFKYLNYSKKVVNSIYKKFYSIPLYAEDFNSLIYITMKTAIEKYRINNTIPFKGFFSLMLRWSIYNEIKKYLSKNHQILNNYYKLDEKLAKKNNNNRIYKRHLTLFCLEKKLNQLSKLEKCIFISKLNGLSNFDIIQKYNLDYKQIDNALQRGIKKMSKIISM